MGISDKGKFVFENYGGVYQLRIRTADDLAALDRLDEPFWIATSAPVDQFTSDPVLLDRLDPDGSGRIHSSEIRETARWLLTTLADRSGIETRKKELNLSAIDTSHTEGQRLYDTARLIKQNLGDPDGISLSLDEVRDRHAIYAQTLNNGDGVIPPGSVETDSLRGFIKDIMETVGSVEDLSGEQGVNRQLADEFMAGAQALLEWHDIVESSDNDETLLPFGTDTAERYGLFIRLEPVIDKYFELCKVFALNEMLDRSADDVTCPPDILEGDASAENYMAHAPLAAPRVDGILHLGAEINPYYSEQIETLAETVYTQVLGDRFSSREFSYDQWTTVKQTFAAYDKWVKAKTGGEVERIGLDKLRTYVSSSIPDELDSLITRDLAAGEYLDTSRDLEFLILLQRWFIDVCNNFVSFPCLYDPSKRAMFETGRLVMGGCVFNLNIIVPQVDSHATVAARSGMYLLYSEVTGTAEDQPFFIVTPVTRGPVAGYGVGKRGVLFDTDGRQWDARVVKVVENPVSLSEAITAPFKRVAGLISSTAEKVTSGAEKQITARISDASTTIETGIKKGIDTTSRPAGQPVTAPVHESAGGIGRIRDIALTGGVLVAALGSSFAFIAKTFSEMKIWHVVTALSIGLTAVIVPTVLIALFKLHRRNLNAVLEASGWAINAPMRLTRPLRRLIVQKPVHPRSFRRRRKDLAREFAKAVKIGQK